MLASSPGPCAAARSRGGRERPPYNTRQTGGGTGNGRPPLLCCRPPTGALWGGRFRPPQTRLPPQTSPAGVNARREDLRHPGRVLARQGAAPLRRLGRHLPLQGRLYRRQSPQSLPCKGRWMRRKAQTEGCIAALSYRYPSKSDRPLPSIRRGRCWHRPGNLAMPQGFPAGVNACREDLRHPGRVLARQGAAPLRRLGRHLPLQGRLYRRQSPQSLPCKGRWMRRKAQTEGCIAALSYRYPSKSDRPLPSIRRGRCWHRPGNLALPKGPRRRQPLRRA